MLPLELSLFEEVADVVRWLVPRELGEIHHRPRRWGIKSWFGPEAPTKEHYEAQVIGPDGVADAEILALEIGFHAEHRREADNDAVLAHLAGAEHRWRPAVGTEAVVGPFLGGPEGWRRISETWPDPDLGAADLAFEIGTRLTDYLTALEPVRRTR
ncbi:MAG: hypothetical protein M3R01_07015 [Actinomycetota bacterium]|nr:hypothetical protein [Actinomycetota bacterium]